MEAGRARAWTRTLGAAGLLVSAALIASACAPATPDRPSPAADVTLGPLLPPTASPAATPGVTPGTSTAPNIRPFAGAGTIALAHADGSLSLVDAHGASTPLVDASTGTYGFPAWSPDGRLIAAIRTTATDTSVVVIDVGLATSGSPVPPRVIFRKAGVGPFYLSWHPEGKAVSFLSDEDGGISLRIAPSDGSAAVDGSGPGSLIRSGSPFYYDWSGSDRLLAHIGTGADAFLGELAMNGQAVAPAIATPGSFRSPDVSADGAYVGYVRAGTTGTDAVVVATRDGTHEHSMPVVGLAALDFSPAGDVLASIGETTGVASAVGVPLGPLRLIDAASGDVRTLLDGEVVSFAWSPDGKTIAAIRVVPVPAGATTASSSPAPSASPSGSIEVHMVFVDVASGAIRSNPEVAPAERYTNQVLTYFDQYALSHRMWAPDSSSILVPQVDAAGDTHTDVLFPDGGDPYPLDGDIGFWSP